MSLYNMIMGRHPLFEPLIMATGLYFTQIDRLRDAYLGDEGNEIIIFARIGGGNREDHKDCIEFLRGCPNFLRDWDDEFDSTFAHFAFKPIVDEIKGQLRDVFKTTNNTPPMVKFQKVIADLNSGKDTPEARRAIQVGEAVLKPIIEGELPDGHTGIVANETGSVVVQSIKPEDPK